MGSRGKVGVGGGEEAEEGGGGRGREEDNGVCTPLKLCSQHPYGSGPYARVSIIHESYSAPIYRRLKETTR